MSVKHLEYDEPVREYHNIIASMAAELAPANGTVLDLGCGTGQVLAEVLAQRSDLNLIGVDGDEECLRRAKVRCVGIQTIQGDIGAPSQVVDAAVDIIISSHSLEHLPSPVDALNDWKQLLTPDGRMIVAVPNSHQPPVIARALFRKPKSNEGHFYIWDWATFQNFCGLSGLIIEKRTPDYVPLATYKIRERFAAVNAAEQALTKVAPLLSNSHIALLRTGPAK